MQKLTSGAFEVLFQQFAFANSKRCMLVLNLQKRTAGKALQMRRLSAFAFEAITLWNFEKKMN